MIELLCYGNNGLSMRAVDIDYAVRDGEVLFDVDDASRVTEDMLKEAFSGYEVAKTEQEATENNNSIIAQIEVLEAKSARSIREIALYKNITDTDGQTTYNAALTKLSDYETQIKALRVQLQ